MAPSVISAATPLLTGSGSASKMAYMVRPPTTVATTACGLTIDAEARVLDEAGDPIPGWFAAGETTGNVVGDMYIASGNSIANCVVYGRVAGDNAARYQRGRP